MKEERIYIVFFSLLRSGLWSKPIDAPESFPLSASEWEEVYSIAVEQTVEGIVFEAIERLNPNFLPPQKLWMKWLVRVTKIEQHNLYMNKCISKQVESFEKLNIYPVLLKGQALAAHYDAPLRRVSGDIDWYFYTEEEYNKANSWAEKYSKKVWYVPGQSMCYSYKGVDVDHHRKMIDIYNPFAKPFLKKLIRKEFGTGRSLNIEGVDCRVLSPLLNVVQVVTHVLKHLLSFGLGLRQLCDVVKLYSGYGKEIDGIYLKHIYAKLGIAKWVAVLHEALVTYLGMERDCLPYREEKKVVADWMMEDVLRAGNFGFFDKQYAGNAEQQIGGRKNTVLRVSKSLWRYGPYAPMESVFFPLTQLYTRFFKT